MTLNLTLHPTWLDHPEPLRRVLDQIRALEGPAPWTPPPAAREPGDDDDLTPMATFLEGMDAPEPVQAPPPAASGRRHMRLPRRPHRHRRMGSNCISGAATTRRSRKSTRSAAVSAMTVRSPIGPKRKLQPHGAS